MPLRKTKKRRKYSRMHGHNMGTAGWGSRKQHRSSGNRGGKGMSGTGKRADHKKSLILKLYGHGYFGKQGITSKKTQRDKRKRINLNTIQSNLQGYIKKGLAKKVGDRYEINLELYKILSGEVKEKLIIKAKEASQGAMNAIKKAGGEIQLSKTKGE
ncbi:MAG: uL15m family ribosomal protein [Nanoarchaeota archaeon]|nr:uL15m family ribosomal protein [Nanoarchaeota archaeon]